MSEAETAAVIRDITINGNCQHGYTATERLEVAEHLIFAMENKPKGVQPVDVRTFVDNALPTYRTWLEGRDPQDWKEGITIMVNAGMPIPHKQVERQRLMEAAMKADKAGPDKASKLAEWEQLTGLKVASTMYKYRDMARDAGMS